MSNERAASFQVATNGWRARAFWALAGAERAVRWAARHASEPEIAMMGMREQWRRFRGSDSGRVAGMKNGATGLVLILPALPWSYRRQRPQQMARAMAELGRHVLYVDVSVRTTVIPPPRLHVDDRGVEVLSLGVPGRPDPYRTLLTPEQTTHLADILTAGLRQPPDFILVQLPFWGPLGIELSARLNAPIVYDRIDRHAEFPGAPALLNEGEATLAARAHHLIASSPGLCEGASRPWRVIPNGVVLEDFVGREHLHRPRRQATVAGYVGALGPWFDADAVAYAAREMSSWTFRLAGRVEDDSVRALARLPNVKLVGEIPYGSVPDFLSRLDVGLVPFRDTVLTRAVDAVKMYEYLAAGLPVVARELPGLVRWGPPDVYHYAAPDALPGAIRRAADEDTPRFAFRRHDLLHAETWRTRATELLSSVGRP